MLCFIGSAITVMEPAIMVVILAVLGLPVMLRVSIPAEWWNGFRLRLEGKANQHGKGGGDEQFTDSHLRKPLVDKISKANNTPRLY